MPHLLYLHNISKLSEHGIPAGACFSWPAPTRAVPGYIAAAALGVVGG